MERDLLEVLKSFFNSKINELNFCLPAKIVTYDFSTQKASVKPLLKKVYTDDSVIDLPIVNNVPVMHPSSGGASITFPVKKNDQVLLVFSQRSLEEWLDNGKDIAPDDPRTFDLTDAIAIIGLRSFNNQSPAKNNDDLMVSYGGSEITIKKNKDIELKTATKVKINSPESEFTGNLKVNGTTTLVGTTTIETKQFLAHTHSGVTTGPNNTGVVV